MRTTTDSELVLAIRKGSTEAAEAADALFARHWPRAWKAAYAVLGDRAAADDAAQRAVERAIRALDQFRADGSFGAWIGRIAINQAIDILRRSPREQSLPESLSAPDVYDEILERDALAAAVARLDADRRVVVALRYWLDMDPPEIAAQLGVPVGTVSSRLSRALSELREFLEVRDAGSPRRTRRSSSTRSFRPAPSCRSSTIRARRAFVSLAARCRSDQAVPVPADPTWSGASCCALVTCASSWCPSSETVCASSCRSA